MEIGKTGFRDPLYLNGFAGTTVSLMSRKTSKEGGDEITMDQQTLIEKRAKVLIVEDNKGACKLWQRWFSCSEFQQFIFLWASTIKEAEDLFSANPDLRVVVMDGCLESDELDTLPLVHRIRQSFTGPMIATSSLEDCQDKLLAAGCNYKIDKNQLPKFLLTLDL